MSDQVIPGRQVPCRLRLNEGTSTGSSGEIGYLLFVPQDYQATGDAWPLLLFLHGAGERGDDLELVKAHGPPKIADQNPDFPFVLISPQCPLNQRWDPAVLIQVVEHVIERLHIDRKRMYATGLSMGGFGIWSLCATRPNWFAAAVPICGGGEPQNAVLLASTPLWVFHGALDQIVPLFHSERMVKAVEAAGGNVKFTVYPNVAHHSWTETYDNPNVYEWLLSHRLP